MKLAYHHTKIYYLKFFILLFIGLFFILGDVCLAKSKYAKGYYLEQTTKLYAIPNQRIRSWIKKGQKIQIQRKLNGLSIYNKQPGHWLYIRSHKLHGWVHSSLVAKTNADIEKTFSIEFEDRYGRSLGNMKRLMNQYICETNALVGRCKIIGVSNEGYRFHFQLAHQDKQNIRSNFRCTLGRSETKQVRRNSDNFHAVIVCDQTDNVLR